MLLSNRLTYCITTFILLLALGGVFVGTSVMAHENADPTAHDVADSNGTVTNPTPVGHVSDDHPTVLSIKAAGDDEDTDTTFHTANPDATPAIPVSAIVIGNETYIVLDDTTTRFTLRIEFSEPVLYPTDTDIPISNTELTVKIGVKGTNELYYYGKSEYGTPAGGNIAPIGSFGTGSSMSVSFTAVNLPDDDPDDDPKVVTTATSVTETHSRQVFDVTFTLGAEISPAAAVEDDTGTTDLDETTAQKDILFEVIVDGGAAQALPDFETVDPRTRWNNMPSAATLFTLTPVLPSTTKPVVAVEANNPTPKVADAIPASDLATTDVVFTVAITDTLAGDDADLIVNFSEVSIDNGTIKDFVVAGSATTVTVTPAAAGIVKLTVAAGAVVNSNGVASDEATGMATIYVIDNTPPVLTVVAPTAPIAADDPATENRDEKGLLVFRILSNEPLFADRDSITAEIQALTINDIDIDTGEAYPLADGDLMKDATAHGDSEESYTLYVKPKGANKPVTVEVRANAAQDLAGNHTPGAEGTYEPEENAPTVAITAVNLNDCVPLPKIPGDVDSLNGGTITLVASDTVGLASGATIAENEVTVAGGEIKSGSFTAGSTATFTLIPYNGETTVTVTVAEKAVLDDAGNGNASTPKEFNVGPIFEIPANTILVITKRGEGSATYDYLSDQPRLPINEDPPTPAPEIEVDVWCDMPDLEVLFNELSFGGTVSMKKHPTSGDFATGKVRISEVMWASDEGIRGGTTDDPEADEQWIEIDNYDGKPAKVFLYARTAQASATTHSTDGHFDRIGNAYHDVPGNTGWIVPGQNGNSYIGTNFVSMYRKYDLAKRTKATPDANIYSPGTKSDAWGKSDREYRRTQSGAQNTDNEYSHVGTPGRLQFYNFTDPPIKSPTTVIPGSLVGENEKVLINEVGNHSDVRYQWIELRNYGSQVADLRNFRITKVTAVGTDDELINFAHNDGARIPVGGVLLLVATDPRFDDDHPIAVGYNIDKPNADQVAGLGLNVTDSPRAPARYDVVNFRNGGLPDTGEFVLIVRSPDKEEPHANNIEGGKGWAERGETDLDQITDIAGYHPDLAKNDYPVKTPVINNTKLWPLIDFGAPNLEHNKLEVDRVHHRQKDNTPKPNANSRGIGWDHDDRAAGRAAFANSGYSGIGYKRTARNLIMHRGTPGYHNNTVNNKANSSVMISEVMYSTGANGTLPQWIELYNSSATKAVHIGSGWRIMIETLDSSGNTLSGLLTIHFGNKGKVKYIYPQQTVLIAAGDARQAGSDFQAASVVFPENRLFKVNREYSGDGALKSDGFVNDRYMFFNPKAFHLALLDKDGAVVDEIGNLDGDLRTNDTVTPDQEFPSAVSEDGKRSSIIRIYDDGVARTGSNIMPIRVIDEGMRTDHDGIDPKYAWIPAVNTGTEFKITIKSTWYGDEDDYGTPGHRRGLVLPVQLSFFRPTLEDGVVTVRWTTESELDNAGFNIYRSETRDGEYKQVNTELIEGAGTTGERSNYSWVDQTAKPGVIYYYQIEDVSFAGDREALMITKLKGLISAKNKLTTTWSELKEASQ